MKQISVLSCLFTALLFQVLVGCAESSEQTEANKDGQTSKQKSERPVTDDATQPVEDPATQEPIKQPKPPSIGADISLEWDESDFGQIWDFESVTTTFPFTNTGSKTLVINKMQAGCGCTSPKADKTVLQPGESGTITVTFDPHGKSKKQDKKVTIFSNSVRNPEKVFWIRSYVNSFVGVKSRFQNLGEMTMHEPHSMEFEIFPVDPDFKIELMLGMGKHGNFITGEEVEVANGAPRRIRINVAPGRPWGAFHSQISITGTGKTPDGNAVRYTFVVFANGKTFGKLRADQHIISLGTVQVAGSYHRRIHVFRADGAPFTIRNTTVLQPTVSGINATSVQLIDGSYEIIVSGTLPAGFRDPINAEVLVETDVEGEKVLRFRIAGNVQR